MDFSTLLQNEIKGSILFFRDYTNLTYGSRGYGLTVDNTRDPRTASIAATGFALTAWAIAVERGLLPRDEALRIVHGTLDTLLHRVSHFHGFFAHFLDIHSGARWKRCEFSTIDTALCLNGVVTAAAYFQDSETQQAAQELLERVDWESLVFTERGKTLFRMAYNPDQGGDYVEGAPGWISRWDMAAEQKMMYLLAAGRLPPETARALYAGFDRPSAPFGGGRIIFNPGGNLFAYLFSEAWLDCSRYLDPYGVDWFENTRLAAAANREFCIGLSGKFRTFHQRSWGASCGDGPQGYEVCGSRPSLFEPYVTGTVSIYSALSCLPFLPDAAAEMAMDLLQHHPQTWGPYGFFDAYNLDVEPAWYSSTLYGIDKGCSLLMIENALTNLVWNLYTSSPTIQKGLDVLGFKLRTEEMHA